MRARTIAVLVVLAAVAPAAIGGAGAAGQSCAFPVTKTDTTGTEVTVEEEPERVVTLAPSAAQTMWEIGAREKVVGVTKYATYLDGASSRANVSGGEEMVVIEKVVAQEPDLVLAPNVVSNDTVEKLRDAGVTVYRFREAESIEGIYRKVRTIGRLTGECEGAAETVTWMQERIGVVREAVEGEERPEVVYLFFGYTAGTDTFIHEVIETAGGDNLAANANVSGYQQLSGEVVVQRDPEWIILNDNDPAVPKSEAYNSTTAVQEDQIVVVQIEHLNQPAPRVVHAITKLAKAFHPEAYAAANATATPTPAPTTAEPTAAATESPTATEGVGAPGFGPAVAVVAVVALLVAGRRRG